MTLETLEQLAAAAAGYDAGSENMVEGQNSKQNHANCSEAS